MRFFLLLLFALFVTAIAFSIDLFLIPDPLLAEGEPNFTPLFLLRTALIAVSSSLIVLSVASLRPSNEQEPSWTGPSNPWANWGRVAWFLDDHEQREIICLEVKTLIVWAILFLSLSFLLIFLIYPSVFSKLAREDKPVETLSALLHLFNAGIFVYIFYIFLALRKSLSQGRLEYLIISFGFALLFFLMGMEEISWGQRVFSIATPELFSQNTQGEMNLHNFATDQIENAYYFAAFAFLILIPFLHGAVLSFRKNGYLDFFVPTEFIICLSAVFVAYNYDMWNILFTQLAFFLTLAILVHYAWASRRSANMLILMLAIIAAYVLTQVLFLMFGDGFVRSWDVSEYKEFLIPLAFLLYSVEMLWKVQGLQWNQPACGSRRRARGAVYGNTRHPTARA